MKMYLVVAKLFRTDGQTCRRHDEASSCCTQFCQHAFTNMLLMFKLTCCTSFEQGEDGFSHRGLHLDLWIINVKPHFSF